MFAGCIKEMGVKASGVSAQHREAAQEHLMRDTLSILRFLSGHFISQVNTTTRTDSTVLIFDFTLGKRFGKGENNDLSISYGDPQFVERGWRYEIALDRKTGEILLSPNDKMRAGIVARTFQTVSATFNTLTQTFEFITRFKELNGNKTEVAETIFMR
jgi:hypothetical protein